MKGTTEKKKKKKKKKEKKKRRKKPNSLYSRGNSFLKSTCAAKEGYTDGNNNSDICCILLRAVIGPLRNGAETLTNWEDRPAI